MVFEMIKIKTSPVCGLVVCALMVFFSSSMAVAGWRIDGARFSQSTHKDLSCVECHTDIEGLDRHPEPANVQKKMVDFFNADKCLECHSDVQGQIQDDASHGGEAVDNVQRFLNCIGCHDPHYEGAPDAIPATEKAEYTGGDESCMTCHQAVSPKDSEAVSKNREFCFSCHAVGQDMPLTVPVMDPGQFDQSTHAKLDCMTCHPMADQYEHHLQTMGDCTQCHSPHKESVAHEAHANVACQACHLGDVVPVRDAKTNDVIWERSAVPGKVSTLHNYIKPDGEGCARCHFEGNAIGAAAMILPPKSVLCMPCHTATISAGDTTTVIALVIFGIGLLGFMSLWFSGGVVNDAGNSMVANMFKALGNTFKVLFSSKFGSIMETIWYDVLLQRRLYQRSPQRWAIHALIFWPFAIRFTWGILALITTNWLKAWPLAWALINKNHPLTALVFDLTGLCLIVGIVLAFVRGMAADKTRTPGLPEQDRLALVLIGGIALVGFVLEGLRIAMTGAQDSASYAFIGYGIGKLFTGMTGLNDVYGYIWYVHAILTGAFVAYLPFSKMMHIIMSPVVLAMNAATKKEHH